MASPSGSKIPESSAAARECESCRLAPGIPFCRVEWSFLCTGCASIIHAHSYVVSVTPNPNLNSNLPPFPYHPYPFPYSFANPSSDPNAVVHLSSDDEELSPADNHGKGCFQVPGRAASFRRLESVMRYREKRKSRKFEKTVRYENRRAYAELRPRLDGKFASRKSGDRKEEAGVSEDADGMPLDSTRGESGGQLEGSMAGGADLGQPDFVEDIRFQ